MMLSCINRCTVSTYTVAPVTSKFAATTKSPVIVPPVNGRALFATLNAELAYEPADTALESAVLADENAELAYEAAEFA